MCCTDVAASARNSRTTARARVYKSLYEVCFGYTHTAQFPNRVIYTYARTYTYILPPVRARARALALCKFGALFTRLRPSIVGYIMRLSFLGQIALCSVGFFSARRRIVAVLLLHANLRV